MMQLRRNDETPASRVPGAVPLGDTASQAALQWLQGERTPRLLVDRNLRILWANNAAGSALDAGGGLRNRSGFLTTGDQVGDAELRAVVVRPTFAPSSWIVLGKRTEQDHFVVHVRKINECEPATYGVSFYKTGSEFRATYVPLERIFELTPVEHRTLLDLLDGHEAIVIARFRSVSVETVRSHIRNIYLKLDVRTREGLFHKLRPYQFRM